jgi:PII-like signaling protein
MNATLLRLHVPENQRHQGVLLWEWLLQQASTLGARGGAAHRPIAAFGRHHVLHEQKFFELAGTLTVDVELLVSDEQCQRLLELVRNARIRLPYTMSSVQLGVVNPDKEDASPSQGTP